MEQSGYSPYDHVIDQIGALFQKLTGYNGGVPQVDKTDTVLKDEGVTHLPDPSLPDDTSLFKAIRERRSVREYTNTSLSVENLSTLLWAVQGISKKKGDLLFRTAPSAGALYPVDTWVAVFNVDGLSAGLARYSDSQHVLQWIQKGDYRHQLYEACIRQEMILDAAVVFIWVADISRCLWRYAQRAYRYIYLDAGHMAQNCALASAALGLGSCCIGAFYDDRMDYICGLEGTQKTVIYLTSAGYPKTL